jgi:hypothetical protein
VSTICVDYVNNVEIPIIKVLIAFRKHPYSRNKNLRKVTVLNALYVNFGSLFTLTTSGIFAFFLARQPQGVLLDRFPPFKPCANEFFLPFSYTKTLARP